MTKIKNYPTDSNPTDNDRLIGSDGDDGNITKNFTLSSLSGYFNSDLIDYINNIIGIGSTGSRLINPSYFNVPGTLQYIVQADAYIINGTFYNTPVSDTVTLNASDNTNNRFDVIVVNIDGSVTSVTGVPSPSPTVPLINDETQVTVTKVLVEANAASPSGVTTTLVFDENRQVAGGEWDTTASPALTIDLESAEQAENGVTSAKFAVESSDNYISFEDTSTYNGADLSTVRFGIYIKKPDNYRFSVKITNVDGDVASGIFFESGQYGFNNATINEWQIITIPANAFEGISSILYDKIQFGNEGDNSEPFYFDFLQIQEGLEPIPSGIPNYTLNFVGYELQLLKDGLVNSIVNLGEGFIPLTGTTNGNPVTNAIEFYNETEDASSFLIFDEDSGNIAISNDILSSLVTPQGQVFKNGVIICNTVLKGSEFAVSSNNPDFKGFRSNAYYGANYDDNTYVQKKYVDDAIAENSPIVREKITITGSAFRTLNSSPVTLIPAPGAGKLIVLTSIVTFFDFGSVQANYASGAYSITGLGGSGTIGNLNFGSDIVLFISQEDLNNNIAINQAIILSNTVGDATVGDSTLNVYVTYEIITL